MVLLPVVGGRYRTRAFLAGSQLSVCVMTPVMIVPSARGAGNGLLAAGCQAPYVKSCHLAVISGVAIGALVLAGCNAWCTGSASSIRLPGVIMCSAKS